jgi:hypothetical protein
MKYVFGADDGEIGDVGGNNIKSNDWLHCIAVNGRQIELRSFRK